jgi:hypothetical protein
VRAQPHEPLEQRSSCVTIMPPSPYPPRFFDGKKLKVPMVAASPAMRRSPSITRLAPIDCAASSITGRPGAAAVTCSSGAI